jgi:hypothetical protein
VKRAAEALEVREPEALELRPLGPLRAPSIESLRRRPSGTLRAGALACADEVRRNSARAESADPFERYAEIIRAHGGAINPRGRASVLGIRDRDGVTTQFADWIVVLTPNGRVFEFHASTRPATTRQGVAELVPGNYVVIPNGLHYRQPSWLVETEAGSGDVPVYRANSAGQYTRAELALRRVGNGILFHVPNPDSPDVPSSIGCLNLRAVDWPGFTDAVGGPGATFSFTLVGPDAPAPLPEQ